jgi:hypothetical protein
VSPGSPSSATLEAEARYARERSQLYKAKAYGPATDEPGAPA